MSKKQTRFFTQIYDDILRSPNLTSHDVRLYGIMLSYCTKGKTQNERVCKLTKAALAGEMKLSERTIYNAIRNLQKAGLIEIEYVDGDRRYPIYIIANDPPIQCPEKLRTNKLKDAISYVRDSGGVRALQRRPYKAKKKAKRTGRPDSFTNGFTLEDAVDDVGDDPAAQSTDPMELPAPTTGNGMPVVPQLVASSTGNGMPAVLATGCNRTGNGMPVVLATGCNRTGNQLPPGTYKKKEQVRDRPNGLKSEDRLRDLALPSVAPPPPADTPQVKNEEPKTSVRRAAANVQDDLGDDLEDSTVAKPTKEELEAERARQRALRGGKRPRINDVTMAESKSKAAAQGASKKPRGAAGGPGPKKDVTQDVVDEHLTEDPDKVSTAPSRPWPLYAHFCRVVRKKFPDARLPSTANGKYLKWGKLLLKDYSPEDLYEMIQVLVLDYENIAASRIFFKFAGTPHPTYEQFFSNRDTLAPFIGTGIVAPPAVRFSLYAQDYNKRHGKSADINQQQDTPGKTEVDPIEALRDQVNG